MAGSGEAKQGDQSLLRKVADGRSLSKDVSMLAAKIPKPVAQVHLSRV